MFSSTFSTIKPKITGVNPVTGNLQATMHCNTKVAISA